MTRARAMPLGLARAYLLAIAPAAFLAPLPLAWTGGASRKAILLYELVLLFLWWRASRRRPVRISDGAMNVGGLIYLAWLGYSAATVRPGLLPTVTQLLLFTGLAKLASLKRPSEARLALLVVFLVTLASASTSTHVSSALFFAAAAWIGFRTLGLLAVLADFDDAPPDRVLRSVPTRGMTAVAVLGGALCTVPLFFALPRLHGPFALTPFRVEDALGKTLASDRVDLESFGAAKRSDRVILRLSADRELAPEDSLRLREAVFTDYLDGIWTRDPRVGARRGDRAAHTAAAPLTPVPRAGGATVISVDLVVLGQGFLFLPYGSSAVEVERGRAVELPDGVMQVSSTRGPARYRAEVRRVPARGAGRGAISPADVPAEIQTYALTLTAGLSEPRAIARRIAEHFAKEFVYTLDPPRGPGDPLVNFVLRSRAGHCEYFASAAAMMLTARGIPARLVTGSYGGEEGLFSRTIVVRAPNLHAWVEADLGGTGFEVFDPTPPGGLPPALQTFSVLSRLAAIGREIEFFYDRRVLGFDASDQVGALEAARESLSEAAVDFAALRQSARDVSPAAMALVLGVVLCVWILWHGVGRSRARQGPATRAYVGLRRLLARRGAPVAPSTPPVEVARLFAATVPGSREDARAVVAVYCANVFGGVALGPDDARLLGQRMRRLRKLA